MTKLNKLLTTWPTNLVYTTKYLNEQGYSTALIAQYKKNNWLQAVGSGAVIKKGDQLDWRGAVMAMQKQLNLQIHVAARTALRMHGVSHYVRHREQVILFGEVKTKLPTWFRTQKWTEGPRYYTSKLFETDLGILSHKSDGFTLRISSRERALFEQLYLVPKHASFEESCYLFEGLATLRADLVQELLVKCSSIKVKRLFMVIAEQLNYPWVRKLDVTEIDFGRGNRQIDPGGTTNSKYKITTKLPFHF